MKICFISPKSYPIFNPRIKSTFGGAEVQLSLIGTELSKKNEVEIHFMVANYGQKNTEKHNKITLWKSLDFRKNVFLRILSFFKVFRQVNADVYIQQNLTIYSGLMALYCKLFRKRFVFLLAHDNETDMTHRVYKNIISSTLANLVFKYSILVISQNEYQKKHLNKRNISSIIIRTGYPIVNDKSIKEDFVLWVARSDPIKRPETFLQLAQNNPDKKFVMICPPATNKEEYFKKIKKQSKKVKNLRFINYIPFYQIDNYFRKAKVFVNTSRQEGFANTFIQSTKNRTPILSLKVNPDGVITKNRMGFCCNDNFDLMNTYLNKLFEDKKLYTDMSNNAFSYAQKNHDIKKIANQIYNLILKTF